MVGQSLDLNRIRTQYPNTWNMPSTLDHSAIPSTSINPVYILLQMYIDVAFVNCWSNEYSQPIFLHVFFSIFSFENKAWCSWSNVYGGWKFSSGTGDSRNRCLYSWGKSSYNMSCLTSVFVYKKLLKILRPGKNKILVNNGPIKIFPLTSSILGKAHAAYYISWNHICFENAVLYSSAVSLT